MDGDGGDEALQVAQPGRGRQALLGLPEERHAHGRVHRGLEVSAKLCKQLHKVLSDRMGHQSGLLAFMLTFFYQILSSTPTGLFYPMH